MAYGPACGPGGDGFCFGRDALGGWCDCACHDSHDAPTTRAEAKAWHGFVELDEPTDPTLFDQALAADAE